MLTQAIFSLAFCNCVNSLAIAPWWGWATRLSRDNRRSPALFGRTNPRHEKRAINRGMEVLPSSFSNNV